jgi:hypothetical protein
MIGLEAPAVVGKCIERWCFTGENVIKGLSEQQRRKLPDKDLFAEIIRIARVPPANARYVREGLFLEIGRVWESTFRTESSDTDYRRLWNQALGRLVRLARLAKELREGFDSLSGPAKTLFMRESYYIEFKKYLANDESWPSRSFDEKFHSFREMDETLDFEPFVANARSLEATTSGVVKELSIKPERRPRGRPRGKPSDTANLGEFVLCFLWDVRAAGGRLTLDKNAAKGSLVEALSVLRPYLPQNFIPNRLPVSTLANIKVLDKKFAVAADISAVSHTPQTLRFRQ